MLVKEFIKETLKDATKYRFNVYVQGRKHTQLVAYSPNLDALLGKYGYGEYKLLAYGRTDYDDNVLNIYVKRNRRKTYVCSI